MQRWQWKGILTWTAIGLIVVGRLGDMVAMQYVGLGAAGVALVAKLVHR